MLFGGHGGFIRSMEERMGKLLGYSRVALLTTANILLNAVTLGRYVWLEGSVRGGVFSNWARRFRYAPARFVRPTTEAESREGRDARKGCGEADARRRARLSRSAFPRRSEHRRHPLHRRARDRERPRDGERVGLRQPVGRRPEADRRQG